MFKPRCSTKMHHVPGLSAKPLQDQMTTQIGMRLTLRSLKRENRKVSIELKKT